MKKHFGATILAVIATLPSLLLSNSAHATSVMFGLIGSYNQFTLPGTNQDSIYRGPGFGCEFSYKQAEGGSSGGGGYGGEAGGFGSNASGFDFSIHITRDVTSNVGTGIDESMTSFGYGGAVDYHVGHFLIGLQYQYVSLNISSPAVTTPVNLKYGGFAGRIGVSFHVYKETSLTLGGFYQLGTAYARPNQRTESQPINQFSGFLNLSFPILSTGGIF